MSKTLLRSGVLLCLCGPAGSGKSTFCERLLAEDAERLRLSVSVTSRVARPGEEDGSSYFFVSRSDFEAKVKEGAFFEWEETHGNYYGTLQSTLDPVLQGDSDLLLDVDIRGALNIRKNYPNNTAIVFLLPPSSDVLLERLRKRGDSEEQIARRMKTAESEYNILLTKTESSEIDYLLVNKGIQESFIALGSILTAERMRLRRLRSEVLKELCQIPIL